MNLLGKITDSNGSHLSLRDEQINIKTMKKGNKSKENK
jgi:hypothetical protein